MFWLWPNIFFISYTTQFRSLTTGSFLASYLKQSPSDSCDNSEFCPYSTVENLVMMAILSFQNTWKPNALWFRFFYAKYILWSIHPIVSSKSFMLEEGRLAIQSLKRVSCCPSDCPRRGNMGACRQWDGTCTNYCQSKHSAKSWGLHKLKPWLKVVR